MDEGLEALLGDDAGAVSGTSPIPFTEICTRHTLPPARDVLVLVLSLRQIKKRIKNCPAGWPHLPQARKATQPRRAAVGTASLLERGTVCQEAVQSGVYSHAAGYVCDGVCEREVP